MFGCQISDVPDDLSHTQPHYNYHPVAYAGTTHEDYVRGVPSHQSSSVSTVTDTRVHVMTFSQNHAPRALQSSSFPSYMITPHDEIYGRLGLLIIDHGGRR